MRRQRAVDIRALFYSANTLSKIVKRLVRKLKILCSSDHTIFKNFTSMWDKYLDIRCQQMELDGNISFCGKFGVKGVLHPCTKISTFCALSENYQHLYEK